MSRSRTWVRYNLQSNGSSLSASEGVHQETLYAVVNVGTDATTVVNGPALLYGAYVNTVLSTHAVDIQDGASAALTITDATEANPIEVTTSAAHGLVSGQTVTFASLPGDFGTNLNGNNYRITTTAATKFTVNVDGGAYTPYTSGGTCTGAWTLMQLPADAAVGSMYRSCGLRFATALVVNPPNAATGSITLAYRPL